MSLCCPRDAANSQNSFFSGIPKKTFKMQFLWLINSKNFRQEKKNEDNCIKTGEKDLTNVSFCVMSSNIFPDMGGKEKEGKLTLYSETTNFHPKNNSKSVLELSISTEKIIIWT